MANESLISAIRAKDAVAVETLLASTANIDEGDEQGWSPLNHAAGVGDLSMIQLLVEKGADVFHVGRDNRTPYMIALAAARIDAAKYLREVEDRTDADRAKRLRSERKYCKAFYLAKLRQFSGWSESRINWKSKGANDAAQDAEGAFNDDKVVFIHQDFTVTESIWPGENVVFNENNEEWREFCGGVLGFRVPDDLELAAAAVNTQQ